MEHYYLFTYYKLFFSQLFAKTIEHHVSDQVLYTTGEKRDIIQFAMVDDLSKTYLSPKNTMVGRGTKSCTNAIITDSLHVILKIIHATKIRLKIAVPYILSGIRKN